MDWLMDGISAAFDALFGWLKLIFTSLKNVLLDLPVLIFEKLLDFISWAFSQFNGMLDCCISPIINSSNGLQSRFDFMMSLPDGIGQTFCFLFANSGISSAFACLSAGLAFRFTRKLVTLGHW